MFMLRRLEELPIGSFHYKMLLVTGLGWLFDAMDTGLIAFVLPLLVKDWGLSPAQAGWIGSVGLIGMALGAVVAGSLADRWGRKKLAYEIKDCTDGFYCLLYVSCEPACVAEVDRVMKITDDILKHMIVRSEEEIPAAAEEAPAASEE